MSVFNDFDPDLAYDLGDYKGDRDDYLGDLEEAAEVRDALD